MYRIPSWLCRSLRSQRIIWDRCWTKSHIPFFFHTPPPHIPLHLYIFLGKTHNWSHTNVCLSVCTVTLSHHNKSSPNSLLVVIPLPTLHSLFLALSLWHSPKSCTHMHSITYILKSASVIYHIVLLIECNKTMYTLRFTYKFSENLTASHGLLQAQVSHRSSRDLCVNHNIFLEHSLAGLQ